MDGSRTGPGPCSKPPPVLLVHPRVSLGLEGTSRSTRKGAAQSTRSGILNLSLNPGLTSYHLGQGPVSSHVASERPH